jgi:hypothetical protein
MEQYEATERLMRSYFTYVRAETKLIAWLLVVFVLFAPILYKAASRLLGWV